MIFQRFLVISCYLFCFLGSIAIQAAEKFPGRTTYPEVAAMDAEVLFNELKNVIVIDARSPYEYETLRIRNAINIPLNLNTNNFLKALDNLGESAKSKKLVFYCNGHTCMKSYKAARRAELIGKFSNTYAFDAGIFDWANLYPDEAVLLNKPLGDASRLISNERLKNHMLPAETFIRQATEDTIVLDVRDRIQRDGFYIFSGFENSISLNAKDKKEMDALMKRVLKENKPLYVYDNVGKQVRWVQYYLEDQGIKDYYFMKGGAMAFFDIPYKNLMDN